MTPDLPPLPEPKQPADAMFYIDGQDLFTADQLRAYAAEAVRVERARIEALAADFQEYLYRTASQVPFEHSGWAAERGSALLAALKGTA